MKDKEQPSNKAYFNINDYMRETEQARRSWRNGVFMFAFGFITGIVAVYLERII